MTQSNSQKTQAHQLTGMVFGELEVLERSVQ